MSLRTALDAIGADAETKVDKLFDDRRAGRIDERQFTKASAATIDKANAKAAVVSDQSVAAQASKKKGQRARPAGIRPTSEKQRLEGAVASTGGDPAARGKKLGRLARNEPYRKAQDTIPGAAAAQGATGWIRVTNPDACDLCVRWADGKTRSLQVKMIRHAGCTCLQQPSFATPIAKRRVTRSGAVSALLLLPNPAVSGVGLPSKLKRYALLRVAARALGVDPFSVDLSVLRAHARLHEEERFRGPRRSPCWANRHIDFVIHRWLAASIKDRYPDTADYLLRTSPRWGRKRTDATGLPLPDDGPDSTGLPLPEMRPGLPDPTSSDESREIGERLLDRMLARFGSGEPDLPVGIEGGFAARVVDLEWADPAAAQIIADTLDDLGTRYPKVAGRINIHSVNNHSPHGPFTGDRSGLMAESGRGRNPDTGEERWYTVYNQRSAGNAGAWQAEVQRLHEDGFLSGGDIAHVVRHEFAHHIIFQGRGRWNLVWRKILEDHGIGNPTLPANRSAVAELLSKYGAGLNPDGTLGPSDDIMHEFFAEAIAEALGPEPRPFAVAVWEAVQAEIRLKRSDVLEGGDTPRGINVPDKTTAKRIVSAQPTNAGAARPPGVGPAMHPDLIEDGNLADTIRRQANIPGFEDFARRIAAAERKPIMGRKTIADIIERMARMMLDTANRSMALSPAATKLHAGWYPFANKWLNGLAKANVRSASGVATTITELGTYAATAALSPSTDWADNVAWAKRMIEIIANQDTILVEASWIDRRFTLATARWEESIRTAKKESYRRKLLANPPQHRTDLIGKRLVDIEDPADLALVIRGWHDVEPTYQLGGAAGFGTPASKTRPQSTDNLIKAVKVLRDGSQANIDATLGGQKVRSFYNNLANPLEAILLDVTGDSHHFGVAHGIPWTSSSPTIASGARNITETPWSGSTGVGGSYPLQAEATRIATRRFNELHGTNFLPNQFQSIDWEQWRAEYPPGVRTDALLAAISKVRTARARGRLDRAQEAEAIAAIRVLFNLPTDDEILEWYGNDLAGEPRLSLTELRKARKRRAKGQ